MLKRNLFSPRRLVTDGILIALFYVLSLLNLEVAGVKLTLEALPITLAALLYGVPSGALVGLLGAFLEQMLRYGFTATTLLWILPPMLRGLLLGIFPGRKPRSLPVTVGVCAAVGACTALLNTAVYYLDSRIYGYYQRELIFGVLIWRVLTGAVLSAAAGAIAPVLIRALKKNGLGGIDRDRS